MRTLALALLCSCGRVGFDPVTDATAVDGPPACTTYSPWSAAQHIAELATPMYDWEPALSPDDQTLVFSRGMTTFGLYVAQRQATAWGPAMAISLTAGTNLGPAWNGTGTRLYFASDVTGTTHLYTSDYSAGTFATPVLVAGMETTPAYEPTISADELEMFYTVPGTNKPARATRTTTTSPWTPLGVVTELDLGADSGWMTLSNDGRTIFLESTVSGSGRIYTAMRAATGAAFSTPALVSEIDVGAGNGDPELSRDGTALLYSSQRAGGAGLADLYVSTRTCTP